MPTDFEILEIKRDATFDEIKQAYKTLVKKWHPDRFPADEEDLQKQASARFHKITEAYKRLETFYSNRAGGKYAENQPDYSPFDHYPETSEGNWEDESTSDLPQFITRTWPNGDKYEGMVMNDQMHGQGMFNFANGSIYTGQFLYGKIEGHGKMVFSNGDTYSGEFRNGRFHGQGKMYYSNGDHYFGSFSEDRYHGHGVFIKAGEVFSGQWEYGSLLNDSPQEGYW